MIKIWNKSQVNLLKQINPFLGKHELPAKVMESISDTINILAKHYGDNRHPDSDLGGYLCIQPVGLVNESMEYAELLSRYGVSSDMAEFTEPIERDKDIKSNDKYQWYNQVFILSSDYTLTLIYKDRLN